MSADSQADRLVGQRVLSSIRDAEDAVALAFSIMERPVQVEKAFGTAPGANTRN